MRTEVELFSGLALIIKKCRNPIAYIDYTIEDLVQCLDGSRTGLWHFDKTSSPWSIGCLPASNFSLSSESANWEKNCVAKRVSSDFGCEELPERRLKAAVRLGIDI